MYDREELIAAEIDLEKIIAAKATHDTTGHYTRPDLLLSRFCWRTACHFQA